MGLKMLHSPFQTLRLSLSRCTFPSIYTLTWYLSKDILALMI